MGSETLPNLLYALLLQDFPESLVSVLLVFSILNLRLWDRRVLAVATLQTITNLVRLLPIAFGVHTVILVISMSIYIHLLTKARLSRIFVAVLVCVVIVLGTEMLYTKMLLSMSGLSFGQVFANPFLRAAFAMPYEIILLLLSLGKNYYNTKKGLVMD